MSDLNVPEQLYQYMVGGHRRFQTGMHREKHKSPSYQIKVSEVRGKDQSHRLRCQLHSSGFATNSDKCAGALT